MRKSSALDENTAERLLNGLVRPADAPPEFSAVADLLRRAAHQFGPATADDQLIAAMAASVEPSAPHTSHRRNPVLVKLLSAKAAAAAGFVLLTATGAAAGTGNLPDAAQSGVAEAASHVGLNLPDPASDKAREASGKNKSEPADATEADATTDDNRVDGTDGSEASTDNHGSVVSDTARNTDAEGREHGEVVSDAARDNPGQDQSADNRPADDSADEADDAADAPADNSAGHRQDGNHRRD